MAGIKENRFEGYDSLEIHGTDLTVWATVSAGPRILGLSAFGSENLLAVLPGVEIDFPGEGALQLIGGHRLWYAPEIPERTYIPDGETVGWESIENGVVLTQSVEASTGVQKQIEIVMLEGTAELRLVHTLTNKGAAPIDLAPWAITQVKPGGVGILPMNNENADPHGLLPNRELVLWPYTEIGSDFITLTDRAVYVRAELGDGALKIGSSNPAGWIAYSLDDLVFVKSTDYISGGNYLDRGASSQVYCNPDFIELETLSPLVTLLPGEKATHIEHWKVYRIGDLPAEISRLLPQSD